MVHTKLFSDLYLIKFLHTSTKHTSLHVENQVLQIFIHHMNQSILFKIRRDIFLYGPQRYINSIKS